MLQILAVALDRVRHCGDLPPLSGLRGDGRGELAQIPVLGLGPDQLGCSVLVVSLLFAWGAWQRRWIADDGLIVLRTVRNLLAGNGPVFNAGERVEASRVDGLDT